MTASRMSWNAPPSSPSAMTALNRSAALLRSDPGNARATDCTRDAFPIACRFHRQVQVEPIVCRAAKSKPGIEGPRGVVIVIDPDDRRCDRVGSFHRHAQSVGERRRPNSSALPRLIHGELRLPNRHLAVAGCGHGDWRLRASFPIVRLHALFIVRRQDSLAAALEWATIPAKSQRTGFFKPKSR